MQEKLSYQHHHQDEPTDYRPQVEDTKNRMNFLTNFDPEKALKDAYDSRTEANAATDNWVQETRRKADRLFAEGKIPSEEHQFRNYDAITQKGERHYYATEQHTVTQAAVEQLRKEKHLLESDPMGYMAATMLIATQDDDTATGKEWLQMMQDIAGKDATEEFFSDRSESRELKTNRAVQILSNAEQDWAKNAADRTVRELTPA